MSNDSIFINHIQAHLVTPGDEVMCKICGKTAKEIIESSGEKGGERVEVLPDYNPTPLIEKVSAEIYGGSGKPAPSPSAEPRAPDGGTEEVPTMFKAGLATFLRSLFEASGEKESGNDHLAFLRKDGTWIGADLDLAPPCPGNLNCPVCLDLERADDGKEK